MAHNAVEARKHHNKRALESDEDLEMREPIKGGTAMSVALFISQLKEGLLKHNFLIITEESFAAPEPLRGTLKRLMMFTSLSMILVSSRTTTCWSASSMRNILRGSSMTLTDTLCWASSGCTAPYYMSEDWMCCTI